MDSFFKSFVDLMRYKAFLIMLLPGVAILLINNYLPMFGVILAFKNVNYSKGILGSPWVGFENFKFLFSTTDAFLITRNTLLYNITFIVLNAAVGVCVAIVLGELRNRAAARVYQTIMFFPYFLSMIVVGYLGYAFMSGENGFINKGLLPMLGLEPIDWYNNAKFWPFILILVNTWKNLGYYSVIYLASIIGIDKEYYEAATIDGAGKWHQITKITIPLIIPQITILTLMQIGRIFNADFGLFYQVTLDSGSLYSVTNVIDTYVYRGLLFTGDIGMAAAAGFYQSVVGFLLVMLSNWVVKKVESDNALF